MSTISRVATGGPVSDRLDDVRFSKAGDDFHVLWTARRVLRLLDTKAGLVAVAVEGISECEESGSDAGLLVVDTAEYYGHENIAKASRVVYSQFKYSTRRAQSACTASDLIPTLKHFGARYVELRKKLGTKPAVAKLSFQFVTNRPVSRKVIRALQTLTTGVGTRTDLKTINALRIGVGLEPLDLQGFLACLAIRSNEQQRSEQAAQLGYEANVLQASIDSASVAKMKEFVRSKALPEAANNKTITRNSLLIALGFVEKEIFPAASFLEGERGTIPRFQEAEIGTEIVRASAPVVIHAAGGIGKSILAQRVHHQLPPGSEVIVFDGFAAGSYRSASEPRHRHDRGLVQIANSLAERGLCDILLPTPGPEDAYLRSFRRRLIQAAAEVRRRAPSGIVVVILDAADNSVMAAEARGDRAFAIDLLSESPPPNSRIVGLARTERLGLLRLPASTTLIELTGFDARETAAHMRGRYPKATDPQVVRFRKLTDSNPRVQANALSSSTSLAELMAGLGRRVMTAEKQIEKQLETALDTVRTEQSSSPAEMERLCQALAVLPPVVPIATLATASGLNSSAIRSFAADFSGGRPVTIIGDAVQFRDEPVETWFQRTFIPDTQQFGRIVDALSPLGATDGYVASALPQLLYGARRYSDLLQLALGASSFAGGDPVEEREVALTRVRFALRAAVDQRKLVDAAKLMLKAGQEAAADERQSDFLMDNGDLVAALAGSNRVFEFIFRKRAWRGSPARFVRCAEMLAYDPLNHEEARGFVRLAMQWLEDWAKSGDRSNVQREDDWILSYASAICALAGPREAARFLGRWRDPAISLRVGASLARRLLEHSRASTVEQLLRESGRNTHLRLGVIWEMHKSLRVINRTELRITLAQTLKLRPKTIYEPISREPYPDAIVALAEASARAGLPRSEILRLLMRFTPSHDRFIGRWDRGRDAVFRFAVLQALINRRSPTLADVTPKSIVVGKPDPGEDENQWRRIYGSLLPWYELRCLALLQRIKVPKCVELQAKALASAFAAPGFSPEDREGRGVANEIPLIWAEATGFAGLATKGAFKGIAKWLSEAKAAYTPTWIQLARIAVSCAHGDCAVDMVATAKDMTLAEHADARSRADVLASIARALFPVAKEEAQEYFRLALELIDQLGDDVYGRVFCLSKLAAGVGAGGRSHPELAYRLARATELLHAHNDHKFPWSDSAAAIATLCGSSAFAIISRWFDRQKVSLEHSLIPVAKQLLRTGEIRPSTATALHVFAGWWGLRDDAHLFFDKAASAGQRQKILDSLIRDLEFETERDLHWVEPLSVLAKKFRLHNARLAEYLSHPDTQKAESEVPVPLPQQQGKVRWARVFAGCDLTKPQGIDDVMHKARNQKILWPWERFFCEMRRRVPFQARISHIRAIAHSTLDAWPALEALAGAQHTWKGSLAVRSAISEAVKSLVRQHPEDLAQRAMSEERIGRLVMLSGAPEQQVVASLVSAVSQQVNEISSSTWFHLASEVARTCLSPVESEGVLEFALDQFEPFLEPQDGDGPWGPRLQPPRRIAAAVAGFLYSMLAAPYSADRWRAAHSVRRLCQLGDDDIVAELVALLERDDLPPFTDNRLPFYVWNARLYLLIALARAAEEAPSSIRPHANTLANWALSREPHVLIRHFASRAALLVDDAYPGSVTHAVAQNLRSVNKCKFPPQPPRKDKSLGWKDNHWRSGVFGMHLDEYWVGPLAETFNLDGLSVARKINGLIKKGWGIRHSGAWKDEPRAAFFRGGMSTHADHGSLPSVDRYSFYLGYHALLCIAGELLATRPSSIVQGYRDHTWGTWLSDKLLVRQDGRWVSDRRDCPPLRGPSSRTSAHWRWAILPATFDHELGLKKTGACEWLTVWSRWATRNYYDSESVRVSSALVTPASSMSLLRALQTVDRFQDYHIPSEYDDLQIDKRGFKLKGWIRAPDNETDGLDRKDPLAENVRWPPFKPGRLLRRLYHLSTDKEQRVWNCGSKPVFKTRGWGADQDDRTAGYHGMTIQVELNFLRSVLRRLEKDLIVEVEVSRENENQQEKKYGEAYFGHHLYTRLFVVKANGTLHTLYGHRRLRGTARKGARSRQGR